MISCLVSYCKMFSVKSKITMLAVCNSSIGRHVRTCIYYLESVSAFRRMAVKSPLLTFGSLKCPRYHANIRNGVTQLLQWQINMFILSSFLRIRIISKGGFHGCLVEGMAIFCVRRDSPAAASMERFTICLIDYLADSQILDSTR